MCGIGGNSIAEAKETLTLSEYRQWVRYRNIRGSLSTPRRIEQSVARLCSLVAAAVGMQKDEDLKMAFEMIDFMPHEDGYEEAQERNTFDAFMSAALSEDDGKL